MCTAIHTLFLNWKTVRTLCSGQIDINIFNFAKPLVSDVFVVIRCIAWMASFYTSSDRSNSQRFTCLFIIWVWLIFSIQRVNKNEKKKKSWGRYSPFVQSICKFRWFWWTKQSDLMNTKAIEYNNSILLLHLLFVFLISICAAPYLSAHVLCRRFTKFALMSIGLCSFWVL